MTLLETLRALRDAGYALVVRNGQLRVRPASALPPELKDALQAHKAELLALYGGAPCFIHTDLPDGELVFAPDNAPLLLDERGRHQGRVVYRHRELHRLAESRPSSETLATLHAIKAEIGGSEYLGTGKGNNNG